MKRAGKYIRMEEVFAVKKQDDPGKKGAGGLIISLLKSGYPLGTDLFYISDDSLLFSCLIDALGALIYSLLYSRTERKERERA